MTLIKQIRDKIHADQISRRRDGTVILRKGFFYKAGGTADLFADRIRAALTGHNIAGKVVNYGEIWRPFRGGATLANQSHWYVEVVAK